MTGPNPEGTKQNQKPCIQWSTNATCKYGNKCNFWHTGACKFHPNNKCSYGSRCIYLHQTKEQIGNARSVATAQAAKLDNALPAAKGQGKDKSKGTAKGKGKGKDKSKGKEKGKGKGKDKSKGKAKSGKGYVATLIVDEGPLPLNP